MKQLEHLVLAGGGHAHLSVLADWARHPPAGVQTTLVTPERYQYYSGMLPGFMAGHYALEECRVDLVPLAERAGVQLVLAKVVALDAATSQLTLSDGAQLQFDWLSLDVGSAVQTQGLDALGATFLPAKPLASFFARWPQVLADAHAKSASAVAVVGAGAAGFELALAAAHAFRGTCSRVHLVGSEVSFLADHAPKVRSRALAWLRKAGVQWHAQRAMGVVPPGEEQGGIALANGAVLRCNTVIATTGAKALVWLADSGLATDAHGFVAVNAQHQSTSHANIFAVGDCCARADAAIQRSGVHAVRAGPIVAHNLRAATMGGTLQAYQPRKRSLYLLACGPQHAVASWGGLSAEGTWVWRWKDHLDRGFLWRFKLENISTEKGGTSL